MAAADRRSQKSSKRPESLQQRSAMMASDAQVYVGDARRVEQLYSRYEDSSIDSRRGVQPDRAAGATRPAVQKRGV